MTDYTAIADARVGDAETTFATLSEQVITTTPAELMLTDKSIAAKLGMSALRQLITGVSSLGPDYAFLLRWLEDGSGINLLDPATAPMLADMVTNGLLTQELVDSILALGVIVTPKWPDLTLGQVINALEMRDAYSAAVAAATEAQNNYDAALIASNISDTALANSAVQIAYNSSLAALEASPEKAASVAGAASVNAANSALSAANLNLSKTTEV